MKPLHVLVAPLFLAAVTAQGAYLLEIDTDGADDDTVTLNAGFSYGGDTTTASQSSASTAFGTSGADSIFGGNGSAIADTYVFNYAPDSTADNLVIAPGQDLGDGNTASGILGGGPGVYAIYATWPFTTNVGASPTNYEVTTAGDSFSVSLEQNGTGHEWIKLGELSYTSGSITVTQSATLPNSFVSMRAYGLLFEQVPEPSGAVLGLLGAGLLVLRRRR